MGSSSIQAAQTGEKNILILGGLATGKSVLAQRFVANTFTKDYQQTFGADLYVKTSTEASKPSLRLWVLSGHERYRPLMQQFYTNISVKIGSFRLWFYASIC